MATGNYVEIDRARIKDLTDREAAKLDENTKGSRELYARAHEEPRRRRCLVLPGARSVADLPLARKGSTRLGRRRERVSRLPQRLRLDGAGTRTRRDLEGGHRPDRARHAFRRADGGRHRRRRGARPPLGTAEVAVRELRLRGDDGRDQDRPGRDGARHDREDLRLLPRPPRLRDGLDRRGVRQDRRPLRPAVAALRAGHPAGGRRHDDRGALQRR